MDNNCNLYQLGTADTALLTEQGYGDGYSTDGQPSYGYGYSYGDGSGCGDGYGENYGESYGNGDGFGFGDYGCGNSDGSGEGQGTYGYGDLNNINNKVKVINNKVQEKRATMIPVLVTTDKRGVFFGYTTCDLEKAIKDGVIELYPYRNCVYWERTVGGVFGLAQKGPDANCTIGEKVECAAWINGVTFISKVSPVAVEAWENAPSISKS